MRKPYGERLAVWQRPDPGRRFRWLRIGLRSRSRDKREWDPVDLSVFRLELVGLLVEGVRPTAKTSAHDLLGEQLRPERSNAEDMGHGVGIPAFGEHRDRHNTTDVLAKPTGLADGI